MEKMAENSGQEEHEVTSTLIGADVVVRGDITGPTDLHVHGRVLGKVVVTGLVLEKGAEIDGPISAMAAVIGGLVSGTVEAKAVHLKSTGRVNGDVSYSSLQIDVGARLSGRLIISDDSEVSVAKLVEAVSRSSDENSDPGESTHELARMAARLRRVSE